MCVFHFVAALHEGPSEHLHDDEPHSFLDKRRLDRSKRIITLPFSSVTEIVPDNFMSCRHSSLMHEGISLAVALRAAVAGQVVDPTSLIYLQ
jgi:hypothetical protein